MIILIQNFNKNPNNYYILNSLFREAICYSENYLIISKNDKSINLYNVNIV